LETTLIAALKCARNTKDPQAQLELLNEIMECIPQHTSMLDSVYVHEVNDPKLKSSGYQAIFLTSTDPSDQDGNLTFSSGWLYQSAGNSATSTYLFDYLAGIMFDTSKEQVHNTVGSSLSYEEFYGYENVTSVGEWVTIETSPIINQLTECELLDDGACKALVSQLYVDGTGAAITPPIGVTNDRCTGVHYVRTVLNKTACAKISTVVGRTQSRQPLSFTVSPIQFSKNDYFLGESYYNHSGFEFKMCTYESCSKYLNMGSFVNRLGGTYSGTVLMDAFGSRQILDSAKLNESKDMLKSMMDDAALPISSRALSAQILQTVSLSIDGDHSKFAAPPPLPPYGSVVFDTEDPFKGYLKTEAEFKTLCTHLIENLSSGCKCGTEGPTCAKVTDKTRLSNLYVAHAYCSVSASRQGTDVGSILLGRVIRCANSEEWKSHVKVSLFNIFTQVQKYAEFSSIAGPADFPNVVGSTIYTPATSWSEITRPNLLGISDNANAFIANTTDVISLLSVYGAASYTVLEKGVSEAEYASYDLQVNLNAQTLQLNAKFDELKGFIFDMYQAIAQNFEKVFEGMAKISEQVATVQQGLLQIMSAEIQVAKNDLESMKKTKQVYVNEVGNWLNAIGEDFDEFDLAIDRMDEASVAVETTCKEFYTCRASIERAELARKKAVAIFDCIIGAVGVVAEVGLMIATAGGASALKGGASAGKLGGSATKFGTGGKGLSSRLSGKAGSQYNSLVNKAKSKSNSIIKRTEKQLTRAARKQATKEGLAGIANLGSDWDGERVVSSYEAISDQASAMFGSDEGERIEAWGTLLETADGFGVPLVGNANKIMQGAYVLANYDEMKGEINAREAAALKATDETLSYLRAALEEIGEFMTGITMEYGLLTLFELPEVSFSESKSLSFWDAMQLEVKSFVKDSDMYVDIHEYVTRRRMDELPESSSSADVSGGLAARRNLMSPRTSSEVSLRRSLDDKDPGCDINPIAAKGAAEFKFFFEALDIGMIRAKASHETMQKLIQTMRKLTILGFNMQRKYDDIKVWEAAKISFQAALDSNSNSLPNYFLQLQRSIPKLSTPQSTLLLNDIHRAYNTPVCQLFRYYTLENLAETQTKCDYVEGEFSENVGTTQEELASYAKANLFDPSPLPSRDTSWIRIPVVKLRDMAALLYDNETSVTEQSIFEFDLYDFPEDLVGCNVYNMEVIHRTFVVDNILTAEPLDLFTEGPMTISVKQRQPFMKYDERGDRHLFNISNSDITQQKLEGSRAWEVVTQVIDKDDDCDLGAIESGDVAFRDVADQKLCYEKPEKAWDPLPLFSKYEYKVGKLVNLINQLGQSNMFTGEYELVMYAKVRYSTKGDGEASTCTATEFSTLESDSSNTGAIIGGVMGGVVGLGLMGYGGFKYYKHQKRFSELTAMEASLSTDVKH